MSNSTPASIGWAIAGALLGMITCLLTTPKWWILVLVWGGIIGAITGVITGMDRKVITVAIVGCAVAAVAWSIIFAITQELPIDAETSPLRLRVGRDVARGVGVAWALGGPIFGGIIGIIIRRWKGWTVGVPVHRK